MSKSPKPSSTTSAARIVSRFLSEPGETPPLTPQIELDGAGQVRRVRWLEDWELDEIWGASTRRPRELRLLGQKSRRAKISRPRPASAGSPFEGVGGLAARFVRADQIGPLLPQPGPQQT